MQDPKQSSQIGGVPERSTGTTYTCQIKQPVGRPRPERPQSTIQTHEPTLQKTITQTVIEHQEEDADNFNCGDLIRANSHSQSELAENILQPENIQVQIIEQAMASGITLQKLSDETSCVPPIWWNLFEQFKICNNYNDERAVANLPFHLSGQALLVP